MKFKKLIILVVAQFSIVVAALIRGGELSTALWAAAAIVAGSIGGYVVAWLLESRYSIQERLDRFFGLDGSGESDV